MDKHKGGRPSETSNSVLPVSGESLADLGIDKMQSSRWLREAALVASAWRAAACTPHGVDAHPKLTGQRQMGGCRLAAFAAFGLEPLTDSGITIIVHATACGCG